MTLSDHLRKAGSVLTSEEARARLLEDVHLRVHQRLIEELGPELSQGRLTAKDLRPRVNAHLQAALADETTPLSLADKARLGEDIANDILGYGPIQGYLEDPEVSEVMVNGPDKVYVERNGKIERTAINLLRDDEYPDRVFILLGSPGKSVVRVTISGADLTMLANALRQVSAELEADGCQGLT